MAANAIARHARAAAKKTKVHQVAAAGLAAHTMFGQFGISELADCLKRGKHELTLASGESFRKTCKSVSPDSLPPLKIDGPQNVDGERPNRDEVLPPCLRLGACKENARALAFAALLDRCARTLVGGKPEVGSPFRLVSEAASGAKQEWCLVAAWCFGRKQQMIWNKCVSLPAELQSVIQITTTPEGPFQSAEDVVFSSELAGHVLLDGDTSTWSLRLLVEHKPAVHLDKMATRDSSQSRVFWNSTASVSANLKAASQKLKSAVPKASSALRIARSIFHPHCLGDTTATTTAFTDDQASMSMDDCCDVDCDPFDLGDVDEAAAPFSKGKQRTDKGDEGKQQKKTKRGEPYISDF